MPIIECIVESITYRNEENGWTVARVKSGRDHFAAVGGIPFAEAGETLRLTGEWTEHPEYGRQLRVTACESVLPTTKKGVEKYLGSGMIRGIGPATAKILVQHFGKHVMDILESEPERLEEVSGIGHKRALMIAESFREQMDMRMTMMFLQQYDITPAMSLKIYRRFGDRTQEILKQNPYRLVDEISGIGFRTADAIALSMGTAPERLKCGIRYTLSNAAASSGHVYLPREALIWESAKLLGADETLIDDALRTLLLERGLVGEVIGDHTAIYLPQAYRAEADVARRLVELIRASRETHGDEDDIQARIAAYESREGIQLCDEQREAIARAVTDGVTIITGGPGTGKTTGIKCIIALTQGRGDVLLTAPTGRAAKRMSEATGCAAQTIHRLLEFSGEDGGGFARDESNPLKADTIIVDEMSMVDIFLMQSLLRAVRPGTRLVLVGDQDQLPSVGAGNVLADLIQSGVMPVTRLEQIFRQAGESMIVRNAHRVNHGEMPLMNVKGSDFFIERRDTVGAVAETLADLVARRLPAFMALDPMRDIQVLSPTRKGDIGVVMLNERLQALLNPPSPDKAERRRGDICLRVGDKVMQTKNNYQTEWTRGEDGGTGVFNGDMGFVTAVDPEEHTVQVTFDDDKVVLYDDDTIDELDLSYCVSVHKSQGSEFPAVVMPVWSMPPLLMTRNLFYTAITRAKKLVVLVGRDASVQRMVTNNQIVKRFSALADRLIEAGEVIT